MQSLALSLYLLSPAKTCPKNPWVFFWVLAIWYFQHTEYNEYHINLNFSLFVEFVEEDEMREKELMAQIDQLQLLKL